MLKNRLGDALAQIATISCAALVCYTADLRHASASSQSRIDILLEDSAGGHPDAVCVLSKSDSAVGPQIDLQAFTVSAEPTQRPRTVNILAAWAASKLDADASAVDKVQIRQELMKEGTIGQLKDIPFIACAGDHPSDHMKIVFLHATSSLQKGNVTIEEIKLQDGLAILHIRQRQANMAFQAVIVGGDYEKQSFLVYDGRMTLKLSMKTRDHRLELPAGLDTWQLTVPEPNQLTYKLIEPEPGQKYVRIDYAAAKGARQVEFSAAQSTAPHAPKLVLRGQWDGRYAPEILQLLPLKLRFSWQVDPCTKQCPGELAPAKNGEQPESKVKLVDGDHACKLLETDRVPVNGQCSYVCESTTPIVLPNTVRFGIDPGAGGPSWDLAISQFGAALNGGALVGEEKIKLRGGTDFPKVDPKFPPIMFRNFSGRWAEQNVPLEPLASTTAGVWIRAPHRVCGSRLTYTYIDPDTVRQFRHDTTTISSTSEASVTTRKAGKMARNPSLTTGKASLTTSEASLKPPRRLVKRWGLVVGVGGGITYVGSQELTMPGAPGPWWKQYGGNIRTDLAVSMWPYLPKIQHRLAFEFAAHWLHGKFGYYTSKVGHTDFTTEFAATPRLEQIRYNRVLTGLETVILLGQRKILAIDVGAGASFGFSHTEADRRLLGPTRVSAYGAVGLRFLNLPYGLVNFSVRALGPDKVTAFVTDGLGTPRDVRLPAPITVMVDVAIRFDLTQISFFMSTFGRQIRSSPNRD